MTAAEIIQQSLKELSVVEIGSTTEPTTAEYVDYLGILNRMLQSWATQKILVPARTREEFPLIADKTSYTIGVGGDFNTVRPTEVFDSYVRGVASTDYDVYKISRNQYNSLTFKQTSGRPYWLYYDHQPTLGVVSFYPTPIGGFSIFLESLKPITQFATKDSSSSMPDEWNDALVYNLAVLLAPKIPVTIDALTLKMARNLKSNLKTFNLRLPTMRTDLPVTAGIRGSETRSNFDS